MKEERSAGVLVFREDDVREYLLLHYPAGHWDYPKGHIESGEVTKETALRELEEETGIQLEDVTLIEGFDKTIDYTYRARRYMVHKEVIYYLGKTDKKSIDISNEHQDFIWLPYEESMKKLTFENARKVLNRAEIFLEKHK